MTTGVGGSSVELELAAISSGRDAVPPIEADEHLRRIHQAQLRMRELGIAALWLDGTSNLHYFTGVRHGQSERLIGALVPAVGETAYLAPAFEVERFKAGLRIPGAIVGWEEDESPYARLMAMLQERGVSDGLIAIDDFARFFVTEKLRSQPGDWRFIASAPVTSWCRQRKSDHEIALLRQAMGLTLRIQAAAARILRPGIVTTEVSRFLDQAHRAAGFDAGALFAHVSFGEATAYPHGVPHPQTLQDGDMVLVDCGGHLHGYVSDITRSYVFGDPSARQRFVWDVEKEAQAAGFAALRAGAPARSVDDACRGVIERAGFGPGYKIPGLPHRAGHGIGMDIHEEPYFVKGNAAPLEVGMSGSIEPMIAIYGEFGVRLEDHAVVTGEGATWLTMPSTSIDDPFGRESS